MACLASCWSVVPTACWCGLGTAFACAATAPSTISGGLTTGFRLRAHDCTQRRLRRSLPNTVRSEMPPSRFATTRVSRAWSPVVLNEDADYTDSELRRWLRKRLPAALVPGRFFEL